MDIWDMMFLHDMTIADFDKLVNDCKDLNEAQTETMLKTSLGADAIEVLARTFRCDVNTSKVATALCSYANCGTF